jgi:MFS family permease
VGRLADTHAQRRVLLGVLAVFVVSGVLFLTSVRDHWPLWTVFLTAGATGASLPPVSSMIRVRWTHLLRGTPRLPTALAMESVVDEFVFIVGPVLVTFLSTTGHTTSGVVTAFSLATIGGLLFAAQRRTEPPPMPHEHRRGPSAMRVRGLRVIFVVGTAIGAVLGTLQISLVAFADEVGARALSGLLIAGLAAGSMVAGIGWGTVHWRVRLRHRLVCLLVLLTLFTVPLALVDSYWLMLPLVVLAGVAVSPSLISAFTLAEVLVPRTAVTEAFTWIGTSLAVGVAVGASVAGRIVDSAGANPSFLVATVAAGVAAGTVALGQRCLHVPAEHAPTPALAH